MEQTTTGVVDLSKLTAAQLKELSKQIRERETSDKIAQREGYELLRNQYLSDTKKNLDKVVSLVRELNDWISGESAAFFDIYKEYGMLKRDTQKGFDINNDGFRIDYQYRKYKSFDERANMAAERLIEFLRNWIKGSENGENNPMYKMAMTLLERNRQGELDYQSISKLYALEGEFSDPEYSDIMQLFKESNIIEKAALKHCFYQKDETTNKWEKIEPSFNRL